MEKIYLLDLNYTLVGNQQETKNLKPFSKRLEGEEYRQDLLEAIKSGYVIMITARPDYLQKDSLLNIANKTGWQPQEAYFNDENSPPPIFKEKALNKWVFPKHGENKVNFEYVAIESNPRTRAMYARYGITAMPYEKFIKEFRNGNERQFDTYDPMELF